MTARIDSYHARLLLACAANSIFTVGQFAAKVRSIPRTTASRHFRGEAKCAELATLFPIADALGYDPRWLATGEGSPTPRLDLTEDERDLIDSYRAKSPHERAMIMAVASRSAAAHK